MTEITSYLIGGAPGSGKTTLGLHVAGVLGLPSLTVDDIRTGLLATTTPDSHPEIHVVGLPDPWTYFTSTTPDDLIGHGMAQHRVLWPAVERIGPLNGTATMSMPAGSTNLMRNR